MNNRRNLVIGLGAAALLPGTIFAQARKPVLIGWLSVGSRQSGMRAFAALKEGLAAQGWKDGLQIGFEERWAEGQHDRLAFLTQDLAAKKPALIVASSLRAAIQAAKTAPTIPIVMVSSADPVAAGLVTSLARPGGMVTGLSGFLVDLAGKLLELLLAATPKLKRVGFLVDSGNENLPQVIEAARRSATHYSVEALFAEAKSPGEIDIALSRLIKEGAPGLVVLPGALLTSQRRRILQIALTQRWPVVAGLRVFAEDGALLSYGADQAATHRRAAYYVDRILKGANPGDLPIEQPTTFELAVNMKTAKALGLTMPPEIMVRATQVIE